MVETLMTIPSLLISAPGFSDSIFDKSVVLLIDRSSTGSIGFIINRPSSLSLKNMIEAETEEIPDTIPAWFGGPVDTATGIILHKEKIAADDKILGNGIVLSSNAKTLASMVQHAEAIYKQGRQPSTDRIFACDYAFRFIVGYAGWGPGQLEDELRNGLWIEQPVDLNILYHTPWNQMWDECFTAVGVLPHQVTTNQQHFLN